MAKVQEKPKKLAILVVYYLEDSDIPILLLHLENIKNNTTGEFSVYGTATRVSGRVRNILNNYNFVEITNPKAISLTGSKEHSHYLDTLVEYAVEKGADYICTLDVDSFPICKNWNGSLTSRLDELHPLISVLRAENDDTVLPHPCCMLFTKEFYLQYRPRFYPSKDQLEKSDFTDFLAANNQPIDSGIGYGYTLFENKISWKKLLRSNINQNHYLLGGIYDDMIFHLGAMGWNVREFRKDRNRSAPLQILLKGKKWMEKRNLGSSFIYGGIMKSIDFIENTIAQKNNIVFNKIKSELKDNPDQYFQWLKNKSN